MVVRLPTHILKDIQSAPSWLTDPAGQVFRSIAVARCIGVAARLGILTELATTALPVDELAQRFTLRVEPLQMMLDVLTNERVLEECDGAYTVTEAVRQHLDPESPTSMATFLSYSLDHWSLWGDLEFVSAGGTATGGRPAPDDDVAWLRRVRGQYEYARRIGLDVADAIVLPPQARSIIDVGGSHGEFSAALCRRSPLLRATVIDTEPAVRIGREIIWEAGLDDVVIHQVGDIEIDELGGPHDVALCLPLLYGLEPDAALNLLRRIRAALRRDGLLAILRPSTPAAGDVPRPGAAALELFLHLDSGAPATSNSRLLELLDTAGFSVIVTRDIMSAPELTLFIAQAL
jgi:hypothetical protein